VTRAELVAQAEQAIERGSKSFRAASRLFDRSTRERAWLLYAWCRRADDIADGQDHGHALTAPLNQAEALARLAEIDSKTAAALAGQVTGDPAFDALGVVAAECAIPHRFAQDLVAGFRLDAEEFRPASADDLYRYCYHVAGSVGCMMAVVMGVDPDDQATLDRACDLGLAFQLANIARDIAEDARAGRCYLPSEWLAEAGLSVADLLEPAKQMAVGRLAARLGECAAAYEASARLGASALSFRSAWAVLAAAGIYGGIARIVARDPVASLEHRVVVGKWAKLGHVGRAYWGALNRRSAAAITGAATGVATGAVARTGLWTRPAA
jgi:15-cis-phytoene synthase